MPAKLTCEIIEQRKNEIIQFLKANPGVKKVDIAEHLNLSIRTTIKTIGEMKEFDEIFLTGSNHGIRYWADPQENPFNEPSKREWVVPADAIDGRLIFLNRFRPVGENLVFKRCKENCQHLLAILNVMAGRRDEANLVSP